MNTDYLYLRRKDAAALSTLFCLLGMTAAAHSQTKTGYLYVGDLADGALLRFHADTVSGTPTGSYGTAAGVNGTDAYYISNQGVTEGVHGTANTLITTAGSSKKLSRFTLGGTYINDLATGFGGLGNIALSANAKYVYAPDESGNTLYSVNTITGAKTSLAFNGVHDVTIDSAGRVYAAAYTNGSAGIIRYNVNASTGVLSVDTSLNTTGTFIAGGSNGLSRPSGMTFASDGSFYVVQNTTGGADGFVYHYSSTGTYLAKVQSAALGFGFGIDQGPDGNLYVASLAKYSGGAVNCVAKIDISGGFSSSSAVTGFIVAGNGNGSTLVQPKYLKFDTNFAKVNDPGVAPEPSEFVFAAVFGAGLVGLMMNARTKFLRKRTRKSLI